MSELPPPGGEKGPEGPQRRFWLWRLTGAIGDYLRYRISLGFVVQRGGPKQEEPDINNPDKLEKQLRKGGSDPKRAKDIANIFRRPPDPPEEPPKIEPPEE